VDKNKSEGGGVNIRAPDVHVALAATVGIHIFIHVHCSFLWGGEKTGGDEKKNS